jgi:hypothetical protein
MPFNGAGVYGLPAGSIQADGTTADAADLNTPLLDIEASLSQVILRNGAAAFSANQSMGGFKLTSVADGTTAQDAVTKAQLDLKANLSGGNTFTGDQTINGRLVSSSANNIVTSAASSGYAAVERNAAAESVAYDFYKINGVEYARIAVVPSGQIIFYQGSGTTERMRIDPNGNLVIGINADFANVQKGFWVQGDATGTNPIGLTQANGSSPAAKVIQAISASSSCTSDGIFYSYTNTSSSTAFNHFNAISGASGTVFRVNGAGTIFAVNTAVQSVSDIRMKENIRNSTEGLEVINALRPVRFDFKEEFGGGNKDQLGFIAQEIEQVFPDAVDTWGESDDPNEPYKSVGPGSLMPVVVKALQEASAKITALEARVATLEAGGP